jgi:hypothetical protein
VAGGAQPASNATAHRTTKTFTKNFLTCLNLLYPYLLMSFHQFKAMQFETDVPKPHPVVKDSHV